MGQFKALLAIVAGVLSAQAWAADYTGPLFDAHLHYNVEAWDGKDGPAPAGRRAGAPAVLGVRAIVANSRPNAGSLALAALPQMRDAGIAVVPLCGCTATGRTTPAGSATRPFTTWCWQSWRGTGSGPYRGIGEFHLYDSANADGPVAQKLMALAEQRDLVVLAHVDDAAIDLLMGPRRPGREGAADLGAHRYRRRTRGACGCAHGTLPRPGGRAFVPPWPGV